MNILDEIAGRTRERIQEEKRKQSLLDLKYRIREQERQAPSFYVALAAPGMSYICELKKASPSKGLIAPDFPYVEHIGEGALAAYTRIVTEVSRELTIPFGVGIMNDPYSAISVAKAVGAVFCRGFFLGSQVGNYGEIRKTPGDIWRYAKSIGAADVAVYSSFEPHNGSSLDTRSTEEMFNTYYKDTPVAGYSMNGPKKGEKPSESMIAKCKALNPDIPINFNNGANPDNIKEMLKYCDMVVVGTTLKKDHYLFNPIDYDNAKAFITAARS